MQSTDISGSPYYDDYDADKNFHRVLFRPRPVQARELNQVQSILMDQISRVGNHLFTEGSMVIPGGIKIVTDQDYVTFNFTGASTISDILDRDNLVITSSTSSLTAKISKIIPQDGSDNATLFIDYTNSGSAQEKVFSSNETLVITENVNGTNQTIASVSVISVGTGTWAKLVAGTWFVRGMFVQSSDQDTVISKYDSTASARVGFKIVETIVDETMDASLLSNANGTPNFKAPGANRLKIELQLTSIGMNDNDADFIELARTDTGNVTTSGNSTDYSVINTALAQRTYETNGNYTVEPFGLDIKEHLLVDNNGGVYTSAEGGDGNLLVAAVKPGIGYVKGYRVQNQQIVKVPFEKARETLFINNSVTTADYGPYILVKNLKSLPKIDVTKKVSLYNGTSSVIGYCRIRSIRKDTDVNYRIYIFDVNMNTDHSFGEVSYIKYSDADSLFSADLVTPVMYGSTKNSLLFSLPVSAVKTLLNNGSSDTSYTVMRSFKATTNASGVAIIGVGATESFASVDDTNYFVGVSGSANDGQLFIATAVTTLSGSPLGSAITINLGADQANTSITVVAPVVKEIAVQRTKTLTTITGEAISFVDANNINLSKADIYQITSIVDASTNEDITGEFVLDNGQRPNWYQVGNIQTESGIKITRDVKVSYTYFEHSVGDYFSVDSYGAMDRTSIGSYSGLALADCVDFRPKKDSNGDITISTFNGEIVRPNDTIRADITYYLPRADSVYINSAGVFGVSKGISAIKPVAPDVPLDAMKLFELYLPPYTSSTADVMISFIDNKRYTMRDIGKLETRIQNVEYYTTLSMLESKTNAVQIFDPVTGNNRYKNGFAVDGFNDSSLADTASPGWAASMDTDAGQLKPSFVENGSDFTSTSLSVAKRTANVFMKDYTETLVVSQPYATKTININPYAVFTWVGVITMTPSSDFWKDVVYMAPVIINNVVNNRGDAQEGTTVSYWTSWSGYQFTTTGRYVRHFIDWSSGAFLTTTETAVKTDSTMTTTTAFTESNSTSTNDVSLGVSVIPYMRSIDINVLCQKFRPFTRLYVFWDDIDVNAECKPVGGNYGDPIVTDENGACNIIYTVPNRPDKSFKTGTSTIRILDNSTNDINTSSFTTIGEGTFKSGGSENTRENIVTNTKVLGATVSATTVSTSSTVVVGTTRTWDDLWYWGGRPIDPIAQTFRVPSSGGSFITKFDVFFATKSQSIPVMLELRTVLTGLPTEDVFAQKILNPSEVNVSADGSVATSFVFDDPVYLEDNVEYVVVLLADTQEYTVYISELGEDVIGQNMALAKQPNLGVFLTSSNSTTWTPNQLQDLKFNIYKAVFNTSVDSVVVFQGNDPIYLPIGLNAITTTAGSNLVTIKMKSHGLKPGDIVTIDGFVTGNGIIDTMINGLAKSVVSSTLDSFTISVDGNANTTSTIGGNKMIVKANYPYSMFMANIDSAVFNNTGITWEYRYTDQATRSFTSWTEFTPRTTFNLSTEGVMRTGVDFQIRATMTSGNVNVSPVIDSQAFTNILISPRVNNDFANPVYAYETKAIQFDNPSTSAVFYVSSMLPAGSNMKLYYKLLKTGDDNLNEINWTELAPKTPISNDSSRFLEYTYELNNVSSFVGYKLRIAMTGADSVNYPTLDDFRSIALA